MCSPSERHRSRKGRRCLSQQGGEKAQLKCLIQPPRPKQWSLFEKYKHIKYNTFWTEPLKVESTNNHKNSRCINITLHLYQTSKYCKYLYTWALFAFSEKGKVIVNYFSSVCPLYLVDNKVLPDFYQCVTIERYITLHYIQASIHK